MIEPFKAFPALRGLSRLADLKPTVIIDTREQTPLEFARLPSDRGTLTNGDYSFKRGERLQVVERKSISDLIGCLVGDQRISPPVNQTKCSAPRRPTVEC
jgi:ERCC4-type nuclease